MSSKKNHKDEYLRNASIAYDIYRKENLAIVMAYFSVGLVGSFLSTPLNIYLVNTLNAEPQMQNTIGILQTLPWSMKLVFGFLSDTVPLFGMHRKPYLAIGAMLYSFAFMSYALLGWHDTVFLSACVFMGTVGLIQMDVMADTMCVQRSKLEPEESKGQMQASCYSIRFAGSLIGAILGATMCNRESWGWGLNFMQMCFLNGLIPFLLVTPTLFTLREKFKRLKRSNSMMPSSPAPSSIPEANEITPQQQPTEKTSLLEMGTLKKTNNSYATAQKPVHPQRGHKVVIVEDQAHLLHDQHISSAGYHGIAHIEILNAKDLSISVEDSEESSFLPDLEEEEEVPKSIPEQLEEIWQTVQLQSVWRPMAFVYIFNLFQVPNVAWQSYLQLALDFPGWILGMTVILGSFMTFAGVLAYKTFFFKTSWRRIYIWTVSLTTFFSLLQLVLIFQLNKTYLHLNNYLFSLGDDVISAYISGIQFLPLCIMYMRLCPEGAEGASYAMLTTFGNIALVCACNVGNLLSNIWDVSNDAMRRKDVSGLWKLNLLTSSLAIIPLSLLFLLPRNAEEQDVLAKSQVRSKTAGIVFLCVLFGSLLWTITTAIMRLMAV